MDTARALGLTRHLLEGLCEVRLDAMTFRPKDEQAYRQLCEFERELLRYYQEGAQAPAEVLQRVEHVLKLA